MPVKSKPQCPILVNVANSNSDIFKVTNLTMHLYYNRVSNYRKIIKIRYILMPEISMLGIFFHYLSARRILCMNN